MLAGGGDAHGGWWRQEEEKEMGCDGYRLIEGDENIRD